MNHMQTHLPYLLMLLATDVDNYKAAISGDGGDELNGYTRTQSLLKNKNLFNHIIKYGNTIYPNFLGTGNKF